MKITPNKLLPFAVKIVYIERENASVNGNPRYSIAWDDCLSWCGEALTQSDAAISYDIGNPGFRAGDWVRLQFTRAGRISHMVTAESPDYVCSDCGRNRYEGQPCKG